MDDLQNDNFPCLQCNKRIESHNLPVINLRIFFIIYWFFKTHLIECLPEIQLFACNFCFCGFSTKDNYFQHKCDEITKFGFSNISEEVIFFIK